MVEILIAALILSMMIGTIGMTMINGSQVYEQGVTSADVDGKARRLVDRIGREFMDASTVVLTLPLGAGAQQDEGGIQADYTRAVGYAGGAMQLGPLRSVRLVYAPGEIDDGFDNNNNSLVDECRVEILPDVAGAPAQAVGLAGFVREYLEGETQDDADENGNGLDDERGLCFTYDPTSQVLTIRVTIERLTSEGRVLTSTAETSVRLRNT
jgi:hypothetical protein